jgi:hypothetical protein
LIRFLQTEEQDLMKYFVLLLVLPLALSAPATATDRTITWRAWKEVPEGGFRVRTGDRYLGGQEWEHYLGFEQHAASVKAIKLYMIHLGSEEVREEVVLRPGSRYAILKVINGTMTARKGGEEVREEVVLQPGSRYAILKVINGTMTARKGVWSWTAQELYDRPPVLPATLKPASWN